jgi:hypothetical protein
MFGVTGTDDYILPRNFEIGIAFNSCPGMLELLLY